MQRFAPTAQTSVLLTAVLALSPSPGKAGNNAQFVNSTIPTAMSPGYTCNVAVTLRNTGDTTWLDKDKHRLGDLGSAPLTVPGRIAAPGGDGVTPGSQHTFEFTIRAPVTAGTYTTRWRMVQENVEWFGETHVRNVVVSYGPGVPATPVITWPPPGGTVASNRPDITWEAVPHDAYEVRICPQNDPNATQGGWSSGAVDVSELTTTAMSGPLAPQSWYYAFVRLRNPNGWSPWCTGRPFYVCGQLMNEPYWVGDAAGVQWPHSICYNPDRNEYLVAFADAIPDDPDTPAKEYLSRVSYYMLNAAGERIAPKHSIMDDRHLDGIHEAGVACDPGSGEYLITYTGWMLEGTTSLHDQLRGQKVDAQSGALKGASYAMFDSTGAIYEHCMAYSPSSDVYLVAWKDGSGDTEIFTTRVSGASGQRIGPIINLTQTENRFSAYPSVAWNSARDEFLVIHQVDASNVNQGWDYYGHRIRASDGALMGDRVQLTSRPAWEFNGSVAYDADLDRYLMVYEAHDAGAAIWGQFLSSKGALSGARFPVLESPYSGGSVWLAWHPGTREFLAAWLDCCSYGDYARRISQLGIPLGERFKVTGGVAGIGNWKPLPVPNTTSNDWLFAWFNSYNDVWTRRYRTLPTLDITPPEPITGFTATPAHRQITLSWVNPITPDLFGTLIRYRTDGYPSDAHDGLPLAIRPKAPGLPDNFVHTGLDRAHTYYYAAFACDGTPNPSAAALLSSRPLAQADFNGDDDVDQEDFGYFQACLAGTGQPVPAGCTEADLDHNGQVDQADLGLFRNCLRGANTPPGC